MRDAHWFQNVFLEVIIEFQSRRALDADAGPVDVDAVFPGFAGLVYEWLDQVVVVGTGELVDAEGPGEFVETIVEEGITEAGCVGRIGECLDRVVVWVWFDREMKEY